MKIKGWDLKFFDSGEWQVCDEKLRDLEKVSRRIGHDGYVPGRKSLFKALQAIPEAEVRVAIIGQDPYPNATYSTGIAFSIPREITPEHYPQTLSTFLNEYSTDLRLPVPSSGDLGRWTQNGVLLWNAIPSCGQGKSLSHDWSEWAFLTREIIQRLSQRGIVFALLGQVARRYINDIALENNELVTTSYPSSRGTINSKTPFVGSRLFSTINAKLVNNGQEPIDWKLP